MNENIYEAISKLDNNSTYPNNSSARELEYRGPITITTIPNMGRGIISNENIPPKTLIMISSAFHIFYPSPISDTPIKEQLKIHNNTVIEILKNNPELLTPLFSLYDPLNMENCVTDRECNNIFNIYNDKSKEIKEYILCKYNSEEISNKIERISESNGFIRGYSGLWILPSFLNHMCHSNCFYFVHSDKMFIYSQNFIPAGDQLFISYVPSCSQQLKTQILHEKFGFLCQCISCIYIQGNIINSKLEDLWDKLKGKMNAQIYISDIEEIYIELKGIIMENMNNIHLFGAIKIIFNIIEQYFILEEIELGKGILEWTFTLLNDFKIKFEVVRELYHRFSLVGSPVALELKNIARGIFVDACGEDVSPLFDNILAQADQLDI